MTSFKGEEFCILKEDSGTVLQQEIDVSLIKTEDDAEAEMLSLPESHHVPMPSIKKEVASTTVAVKSPREFLTEFIELYYNLPCLWLIRSKEYSDRHKKEVAYTELLKKYHEYDPSADRATIARKINSLRSVYRKERAKVLLSLKSAACDDDVYRPTLWYYDLLTFLDDQDAIRPSRSTMEDEEEGTPQNENFEFNDLQQCQQSEVTHFQQSDQSTHEAPQRTTPPPKVVNRLKRRKDLSAEDEVIEFAGQRPKTLRPDDEFEAYGNYIAHKLRSLKGNQAVFARKLINDVIFEGELDTLTREYEVVRKIQPHRSFENPDEKISCAICQDGENLLEFTRAHDCPLNFPIESDETEYPCKVCRSVFKTKSALVQHMIAHSDEKPYGCSLCDKTFKQKGSAKQHEFRHTGERPITCQYCRKRFRNKYELKDHSFIHTGEKPYTCQTCGKSFRLKASFKSHKLVHSEKRAHPCPHCDLAFKGSSGLKRHILVHTGEKLYVCDHCKRGFIDKPCLVGHIICKHLCKKEKKSSSKSQV